MRRPIEVGAADERPPGLDELAGRLGMTLVRAEPAEWGDGQATWLLAFTSGETVVARRFATDAPTARRAAIAMQAAARAGIPAPAPKLIETRGDVWLISEHVRGQVGSAWLDSDARARTLASAMGRLCRGLAAVDVDEIPSAVDLEGRPHVSELGVDSRVVETVEAADRTRAARRDQAVFVHGDFAPINVIVDGAGEIAALLDFEHARVGDPLDDIAWWGWVVRHHHPEAWAASWSVFRDAAGAGRRDEPVIRALMLHSLARRAIAATDDQTRARWVDRLSQAAGWSDPTSDQAT